MKNKLYDYVNDRYEHDGVLPDADELYTAFQVDFDSGVSVDVIDDVLASFARIHDMTGIFVEWEGYSA